MKTDWKGQFCSENSEKNPAVLSRHEVGRRCWFVGRLITMGVYLILLLLRWLVLVNPKKAQSLLMDATESAMSLKCCSKFVESSIQCSGEISSLCGTGSAEAGIAPRLLSRIALPALQRCPFSLYRFVAQSPTH